MNSGRATCWPSSTVTTMTPASQAKNLNVRTSSTEDSPANPVARAAPAGASRTARQSKYAAKAASNSAGTPNASGNSRTIGGQENAVPIAPISNRQNAMETPSDSRGSPASASETSTVDVL